MKAQAPDVFEMAESLPVDIKLVLIDRLLESISPTWSEIDELWKIEVKRRIEEIENGTVQAVPGEEVFAKIKARFDK